MQTLIDHELPLEICRQSRHKSCQTCRYEAAIQQAEAMEKPYTALAKLLNCDTDEVAIVTSATTAWFQVCCHCFFTFYIADVTVSHNIVDSMQSESGYLLNALLMRPVRNDTSLLQRSKCLFAIWSVPFLTVFMLLSASRLFCCSVTRWG